MEKPRISSIFLQKLAKQSPVVSILGPRQAGKSTLARIAFPGYAYLDLENPSDYARLADDPMYVFGENKRLIVDEAQRLPALFPALRSHIDLHPTSKVILLGSASPEITRAISESLAGRVAYFELGGISILEEKLEAIWIQGGFPRIHWSTPKSRPEIWYPSYLKSYLEQDIPQLGYRVSSVKMRNLLTMIAHSQGGICNLSELGGSLGLNYHSVSHLIDLFEGTYLVRRLQPYFVNIGKRLTKSPKLYIRDTGILSSLLGLPFTRKGLLGHPKAGASFETFCIEQILNQARLKDPASEAYFYRTQTGVEIDLILKLKGRLIPIEIKMSDRPQSTRQMEIGMKDLGLAKGYQVLLGAAKCEKIRPGIYACDLMTFLDEVKLV